MISPEISAVLFAGGKGYRMGELGKHTQKCLLPFEGKPILVGPGNVIVRSDLYLSIMTLLTSEKATTILSLSDNKKEATTHNTVEIKTIGKLPNSWEYGLVHKRISN